MPTRWFLDFDDTLATGPITWSVDHALPKLVEENQLICNRQQLSNAVVMAQAKENQGVDHQVILNELFDTMRWPSSLQESLYSSVMTDFHPQLFDDVIPFLNRLRDSNQPVYVISNNPRSRQIADKLGISTYFMRFFTPAQSVGIHPKPHRSLWDSIISYDGEVKVHESRIVGDDPWSDGQFAENCGLPCWIVDRGFRYRSLYEGKPYTWVQSLLDIPINQI